MIRRRLRDDRGAVAAEFAVVLPVILLVVALGVGALASGGRQVRLQDAVADAARLAARGEGEARVRAAVEAAIAGADISIEPRGDLVCVRATAPIRLPGTTGPLAATAESCALAGGL